MPSLIVRLLLSFSVLLATGVESNKEGSIKASEVVELDITNFDAEFARSKLPFFVDFYSPKCTHCVRLAPTWEKLANDLKGKVTVAKIDASKERVLARRFQIRGYPTLVFITRDMQARQYEASRSLADLIYATEQQCSGCIPFPSNPMSLRWRLWGRLLGAGLSAVAAVQRVMEMLHEQNGVPSAVLGIAAVVCAMLSIAVVLACCLWIPLRFASAPTLKRD